MKIIVSHYLNYRLMGVKHLFSVKAHNNKIIKELGHHITCQDIKNSKIAIDASIYIYSFLITKCNNSILTNKKNSIYCILKKVFEFKSNKIEQIWVFDYNNKRNVGTIYNIDDFKKRHSIFV